jgi:hypothetical protein
VPFVKTPTPETPTSTVQEQPNERDDQVGPYAQEQYPVDPQGGQYPHPGPGHCPAQPESQEHQCYDPERDAKPTLLATHEDTLLISLSLDHVNHEIYYGKTSQRSSLPITQFLFM